MPKKTKKGGMLKMFSRARSKSPNRRPVSETYKHHPQSSRKKYTAANQYMALREEASRKASPSKKKSKESPHPLVKNYFGNLLQNK